MVKLIRGTMSNRTYGTHKNLSISLFLLYICWSYLLWSPGIEAQVGSPAINSARCLPSKI